MNNFYASSWYICVPNKRLTSYFRGNNRSHGNDWLVYTKNPKYSVCFRMIRQFKFLQTGCQGTIENIVLPKNNTISNLKKNFKASKKFNTLSILAA